MTRPIYVGAYRVDVTVRAGVSSPVAQARLARAIVAAAAGARAPDRVSVGLILAGDAELATLNATHLGKDGPTDVLSFPLLPPSAFPPHRGARSPVTKRGPTFRLPPGRRVHLGDIVISVERAIAQAMEGRGGQTGDLEWSPASELLLLVTHGTLHLCGWDHADPAEEAAMRSLERRLLRPVANVV